MTQKTKQLKQFITFTILAGFLLLSCQVEEEFVKPNSELLNGKIYHKKFEDLIKETEFKTAFERVMKPSKIKNGKSTIASKTVM